MKRSGTRRLVAAAVAVAAAMLGAAACTVPPPPTVSWEWIGVTLPSPGAGINAGENAALVYTASNVPAADTMVVQRGIKAGKATAWTSVLNVPRVSDGFAILSQPPFGRDSYRIAVVAARGKVVASTIHTLDVYRLLTLGLIADRPTRTAQTASGAFTYYFQTGLTLPRTSCRDLTDLRTYNSGTSSRTLTISGVAPGVAHTFTSAAGSIDKIGTLGTVPGWALSIQVQNPKALGNTLDIFGEAHCFTANGTY